MALKLDTEVLCGSRARRFRGGEMENGKMSVKKVSLRNCSVCQNCYSLSLPFFPSVYSVEFCSKKLI